MTGPDPHLAGPDTSQGTPPPEIEINVETVQRLLIAQHPDLAQLPLRPFTTGWDNALLRLGDELMVRIPHREVGHKLLQNELRWLPQLAPSLPLPTPNPVRIGKPCAEFPWVWTIVPWIEGQTSGRALPLPSEARTLARFFGALHQKAPADAPQDSRRGLPLVSRSAATQARLDRLARTTPYITAKIRESWEIALEAKPSEQFLWLHGDLHPENMLTRDGHIAAILDWGDMTAGDPASDLATVFMIFPAHTARDEFWEAYASCNPALDADMRARARGWAISQACILLETGLVDNPEHAANGRRTFDILNR